ncbi:hypothetical protein HKX48_005779 [Thoreauomyces humboldtii]|nr:hypothetical protein HKX48_005779 [Thoreauomyces humboldtii]
MVDDKARAVLSQSKDYMKGSKWPVIVPKLGLQLQGDPSHLVFLIHDFLSGSEASSLRDACALVQPFVTAIEAKTRAVAFRDNDRSAFDSPELSEHIWNSGLSDVVVDAPGLARGAHGKKACGLNPYWRLYRYRPGQKFGPHYDEAAEGADGTTGCYTLLIYLSGAREDANEVPKKPAKRSKTTRSAVSAESTAQDVPLRGGNTQFYKGSSKSKKLVLSIPPVTGIALLHAQGEHCMLHEGAEVTQGEKWASEAACQAIKIGKSSSSYPFKTTHPSSIRLRAIHFTKMSPKARAQFVSPPPGSPLVSSPDQDSNSVEEIKDDDEELTERALRNFALLVFEVKGADHLDLSEHPNRRSKYAAPTLEDGEWTVTRVNA